MISNEMRLQHHCNLSGKINAAECALLPRVSASSENGGVSLALFFFPPFFFPPGSLNAFFFFLWRTRCVFAHKLSGLYSFTRICCEYLMVDGASVQGLSMPTKRRCKIAAISFHFLPRCGFCCCLFVYFFFSRKRSNVKPASCWRWRWAPQCGALNFLSMTAWSLHGKMWCEASQIVWGAVSLRIIPKASAPP